MKTWASTATTASQFVPYTGATANINLGAWNITTTGTVTATNIISMGKIMAGRRGFATQF